MRSIFINITAHLSLKLVFNYIISIRFYIHTDLVLYSIKNIQQKIKIDFFSDRMYNLIE